jgi:hypothetical protein
MEVPAGSDRRAADLDDASVAERFDRVVERIEAAGDAVISVEMGMRGPTAPRKLRLRLKRRRREGSAGVRHNGMRERNGRGPTARESLWGCQRRRPVAEVCSAP